MYLRALLLLLFIGNVAADEQVPFQADYEFRVNGMALGATAITLVRETEARWVYTDYTHPTGLLAAIGRDRREVSTLTLHDGSPRPLDFQGHDGFRSKPRAGTLHFDWNVGVVSGTWNNAPWSAPLTETFHDPLSYQLAIMHDLAQGKQTMDYLIAEDAKVKSYHFRMVGQETTTTLAGRFETVRVEREQDSDKRHTTLWCAPSLAYLPVQVEQQDGGTRYGMVLRTIEGFAGR